MIILSARVLISIYLILNTLLFSQSLYRNIMISDEKEPSEVTISINYLNTNNIVAAANIGSYFYSFDGGITWEIREAESKYGIWGDPCVVTDTRGYFYYFHLSNYYTDGAKWLDRIVCQRSTDGGISWNEGSFTGINVPHLQDKEWAAVDLTTSPHNNNIYVAWTQCGQNSFNDEGASINQLDSASNIIFSFSTDAGESWSKRIRINEIPGRECFEAEGTVLGAIPCVGLNGEVYVAWASPNGIILDKSSDGGINWLENDIIVTELPGGFKYSVPGVFRCFGFPSMACDYYSSFKGNLYISWADQRRGPDNTDVWIAVSTNGGLKWSDPTRVNDDEGSMHQFFSWMTIDQSNGYIYIVFYDRRYYRDNSTDVFLAKSTDGGKTFSNERISSSPFVPDESIFMGDYTNIAAVNGMIRPVWTRLDSGKLSIQTAIINE